MFIKINEAELRKYATLMKELELTGLEITEGESKVRLEREGRTCVQALPAPAAAAPSAAPAADAPAAGAENGCISVKSPLVGVFYAAPSETSDPFVSIGDRVEKGSVLCIIEAMKMMNEICAEEDGVISEICVTNGQVVEYGTELFRIKK